MSDGSARQFECPNGHRWEAAAGRPGEMALGAIACPECGAPASTLGAEPVTPTAGDAPSEPGPFPAVPGYEVLGELGRGGMGVVLKARQLGLNRLVALKLIRDVLPDAANVARFRAEAEAVARVQHPNIVQIHEIGEAAPGVPFLALEYLPAGTLASRLMSGPLPPAEAARLAASLARAVAAAHAVGVVHRDLKPANVLLTTDGTPKLTDFGVAKLLTADPAAEPVTRTGQVVGTPAYMAPEQAAGQSAGPAADVWALGAVLYACLTGRPPFQGTTVLDTLDQVRTRDPVPVRRLQPAVPRDLETVCLKCLEKAPARRYASATALADDLDRFLASRPVTARPVGPVGQGWRLARRNPTVASLLALVVLAVASGFAAVLWQLDRVRNREAAATASAIRAAQEADRANRNSAHALRAADVLVAELAEGIRPLAGTRSPAVERILERADGVYDDLLREDPSPAVRAGRARLLTAFADLDLETDHTRRSEERAAAAVAVFEQLRAEQPDDPGYASGLAAALEVQAAAHQAGRLAAAGDAARRSLDLRQALADGAPNDPDRQHDLATAHLWVGWVRYDADDLDGAGKAFDAAWELAGPLADRYPDRPRWQWTAGVALEKRGDVLFHRPERLVAASAAYDRAAAVFDRLAAAEPGNLAWQLASIRVNCSRAELELERKEFVRARQIATAELGRAKRVAGADPTSGRRRFQVIRCQSILLTIQGHADPKAYIGPETRQLQEAKVAALETLVAGDPDHMTWRVQLAASRVTLANLLLEAGRSAVKQGENTRPHFDPAWAHVRAAVPASRALTELDPNRKVWRTVRLNAYYIAAELADQDKSPPADPRPLLTEARDYYHTLRQAGDLPADYQETLELIERLLRPA